MSHAERALHRAQELRGRLDRRRRVLLRDFLIFELKLLLDSLKGLLISQAALVALIIDLLRPGGQDRRVFYKVLNLGERADSWLSLYGASERAAADPEGLLGVSREGSNTLLGQLEHIVHRIVVGDHAGEGELYGEAPPAAAAAGRADVPPAAAAAPGGPPQADATGPSAGSSFEELHVRPQPPA